LTAFLTNDLLATQNQLTGEIMNQDDVARCAALRESMRPLGDRLDELDNIRAANGGQWTGEQAVQYRLVDSMYQTYFDELFDLDPAVSGATF